MRSLRTSFWLLVAVATAVPSSAQAPPAPESIPAELPESIPVFPLEEVMLFPGMPRPFHIFEPRYREMVLDALVGERIIGMVVLQPGFESDYQGRPPIYSIGCAGFITSVEELPDGRYNIVLRGLTKFRVKSERMERSYRLADVEAVPESMDEDDALALSAHRPRLLEMLSLVASGPQPSAEQMPDPELVNGLAQFLPMDSDERLDLLERNGPLERAKALIEVWEKRYPP